MVIIMVDRYQMKLIAKNIDILKPRIHRRDRVFDAIKEKSIEKKTWSI